MYSNDYITNADEIIILIIKNMIMKNGSSIRQFDIIINIPANILYNNMNLF